MSALDGEEWLVSRPSRPAETVLTLWRREKRGMPGIVILAKISLAGYTQPMLKYICNLCYKTNIYQLNICFV
jgi:hypothetical protein